MKKMFLKISQNSQKSTGIRISFLIKLQLMESNFVKKKSSGTGVFQ